MSRPHTAALLALAALGLSSIASADPPRGDSDPCRGLHTGDPCSAEDFEGVCRRRRCTRETDDGVRSFHCLVCESRHQGHHRRHRDLDAGADDAAADAVSAEDVTAVADVVEPPPDAPATLDAAPWATERAPAVAPKRGLFSCAAGGAGGGGEGLLGVLVACGLARRRALSRR